MLELELAVAAAPAPTLPAAHDEPSCNVPPQAKTVRETGLELALLVELVAKSILVAGRTPLPVLTGKLRLSINALREVLDFMIVEQLVEVAWRGDTDLDVQYQLTSNGKQRAQACLARCRYVGPAPVSLAAYREVVQRQSSRAARAPRVLGAAVQAAFADDCLALPVIALAGAALHAGRSLLLHGPSGSGKTTLARKLGRLQQGLVAVPYAIVIDQQIVQVYDPLLHLPPSPLQARQAEERRSVDARWVLCQRPVLRVGAELSADMLDLRHDSAGGIYHAPIQLRASGGMLLFDDLGHTRVPADALLARFGAALDGGVDVLTLDGGHKVGLPFDAMLVLATSAAPDSLFDAAAMRRIGFKVAVGPLSEASYRKLFRLQCRVARIVFDEQVLDHLLTCLHAPAGQPLLASTPRELLGRIADFASYADEAPRLTVPSLEQAWTSLFAGCSAGAQ